MKISTKGRYALRLMLDIAAQDGSKPVRIKEIAARQQISEKYLEQLISTLNSAGFVRSIRGAQGGYLLKKQPSEYTVGMILRLMEGTLAPVYCVEHGEVPCERMNQCASAMMVWKKLSQAINDVVDNITLQDMLDWQSTESENEDVEGKE